MLASNETFTATKANTLGLAGTCVGRARRITNSSTTTSTTRVAVLELDDIAIKAGRLYEISTSGLTIDGPTANDTMAIDILYTTDGSTPTTSSTVLPGSQIEIQQPNATPFASGSIHTTYTPAADETLSLLMCIRHTAGTGAMAINATGSATICEMLVIDRGEDPGDTGVDL